MSSITDVDMNQAFGDFARGVSMGATAVNMVMDAVDPDSRRVPQAGAYGGSGYGYPRQQRAGYGYGYGDPSGMYQQSYTNYPGISSPMYGKGGGFR